MKHASTIPVPPTHKDANEIVTTSTVYYFVDSNLFFQCLPLEQIDWTPWDASKEVRLIVSNPVLREIDFRKNKSNDRVGSRARVASAMFRKMLNEGHRVVRPSNPRVILVVEPQHTYSPNLENQLNYGTYIRKLTRRHINRSLP